MYSTSVATAIISGGDTTLSTPHISTNKPRDFN